MFGELPYKGSYTRALKDPGSENRIGANSEPDISREKIFAICIITGG